MSQEKPHSPSKLAQILSSNIRGLGLAWLSGSTSVNRLSIVRLGTRVNHKRVGVYRLQRRISDAAMQSASERGVVEPPRPAPATAYRRDHAPQIRCPAES